MWKKGLAFFGSAMMGIFSLGSLIATFFYECSLITATSSVGLMLGAAAIGAGVGAVFAIASGVLLALGFLITSGKKSAHPTEKLKKDNIEPPSQFPSSNNKPTLAVKNKNNDIAGTNFKPQFFKMSELEKQTEAINRAHGPTLSH